MRALVEGLCSEACAGRAAGTAGGRRARRLVLGALRRAGLDPHEQEVPGCRGANVLAALPGDVDRWVLVAAHYDHLGVIGGEIYRGADDNAAAVAVLVEVGRALAARRPAGRGVILAAFDGEEPPHFMTGAMGSEHYARHPTVPLEAIDLMICMDLVGHALGPPGLAPSVRETLFALGAEKSRGTRELLRGVRQEGVRVRPLDAAIVPPLSDYAAFWQRRRPFVFLTGGRARTYHTPADVPAGLAWSKIEATAGWLERFVRRSCEREGGPTAFVDADDDLSTLESLVGLLEELGPLSARARGALERARALRALVGADRALPGERRLELATLVAGVEASLA